MDHTAQSDRAGPGLPELPVILASASGVRSPCACRPTKTLWNRCALLIFSITSNQRPQFPADRCDCHGTSLV